MCEPPGNSARTTALWSAQAPSRDYPMSTHVTRPQRDHLLVAERILTKTVAARERGPLMALRPCSANRLLWVSQRHLEGEARLLW